MKYGTPPTRILVIEDNQDIVKNLYDYFDDGQYLLDSALDGLTGLHLATTNPYSVILLDLSLPGIDGITLCKRLREDGKITTPIIMLTAREKTEEKIKGLEAGADDYLIKPFSLGELKARIEAVVRRSRDYSNPVELKVGSLIFDVSTMEVTKDEQAIDLTPVLLKILEKLMSDSPKVVSKGELEFLLWGDTPPASDALRSHIHALRSAIDKPFGTSTLQTVHGIGYRITP